MLAAELEEVSWDGILSSYCCLSPAVPLFQVFQPGRFTASLFNPPIIREPIIIAQDSPGSLSNIKRAA